jgi:hypothetical protein
MSSTGLLTPRPPRLRTWEQIIVVLTSRCPFDAVEFGQDRGHLAASEHPRQPRRPLGANHVIEPRQFHVQHVPMEEQQGAQTGSIEPAQGRVNRSRFDVIATERSSIPS